MFYGSGTALCKLDKFIHIITNLVIIVLYSLTAFYLVKLKG